MTAPRRGRARFDKLKALQEQGGRVCALGSFRICIDCGHSIETEALDAFVTGCVMGLREAGAELLRKHGLQEEFIEFYVEAAETAFRTEFRRLVRAWQSGGGRA
jgi:hypothetical protein